MHVNVSGIFAVLAVSEFKRVGGGEAQGHFWKSDRSSHTRIITLPPFLKDRSGEEMAVCVWLGRLRGRGESRGRCRMRISNS